MTVAVAQGAPTASTTDSAQSTGAALPGSSAGPTGKTESTPINSGAGPKPQADAPDEPAPLSTPIVQMIPSAGSYAVGDTVSVAVSITSARDVGHVPFHVLFDPQVLRFEYGEEGPFLSSDGRQTAFFASATTAGAAVVVGLSRLGRGNGISGGGSLCILHFTAVGPGNAGLAFAQAKVRDSSNRIVESHFVGAAVVVE